MVKMEKKKFMKIIFYLVLVVLVILWISLANAQSSRFSKTTFHEPSYKEFYRSQTGITDYKDFFPVLADADKYSKDLIVE